MTRCKRADHLIAPAFLAVALATAVTGSAEAARVATNHDVTVRCTEILKNPDVTNGGIAGTGHCTLSGKIEDKGKATDYRR